MFDSDDCPPGGLQTVHVKAYQPVLVDWAYDRQYKWFLEFYIKDPDGTDYSLTTRPFDAAVIPSPGRYSFPVPALEPGRYQFWRRYFDPRNTSDSDARVTHNVFVDEPSTVWPNLIPPPTITAFTTRPVATATETRGAGSLGANTAALNVRVVFIVIGVVIACAFAIVLLMYLHFRKIWLFKRGTTSEVGLRRSIETPLGSEQGALGKKTLEDTSLPSRGGFLPREVEVSSPEHGSPLPFVGSPGTGSPVPAWNPMPDASQYPSLSRSQTSVPGTPGAWGDSNQQGSEMTWISASYHRTSISSHRPSYRAPSIVSRISGGGGPTLAYYANLGGPGTDGRSPSVVSRMSQREIFRDLASERDSISEDGVVVVAGPDEEVDPVTGEIVPKRPSALSRLRTPSVRSRRSTGNTPVFGGFESAVGTPVRLTPGRAGVSGVVSSPPLLGGEGGGLYGWGLNAAPLVDGVVFGGDDDDEDEEEDDGAWRFEGEDEEERAEREGREGREGGRRNGGEEELSPKFFSSSA
ncbi:hypothetical protein HDU67_008227 [Dinochytrium kinnereticum]|nr:hypothetical protein HDU67_008227 [Dinochytrium kinnereticum]